MVGAAIATSVGMRAPFGLSAILFTLVAVWAAVMLRPRPAPQDNTCE
jgi:hypothetical protein